MKAAQSYCESILCLFKTRRVDCCCASTLRCLGGSLPYFLSAIKTRFFYFEEPAKPSFSFGTPTSIGKPTEAPKMPGFGTGSATKPEKQANLSFGLKQREDEPSKSGGDETDAPKIPTFQFGAPLKVGAG